MLCLSDQQTMAFKDQSTIPKATFIEIDVYTAPYNIKQTAETEKCSQDIAKKSLNDANSFDDCQPSSSKLENRQRCQKP